MAEQRSYNSQPKISVDLVNRIFSYNETPSKSSYSALDVRYWNNMIILTFTKKITDENEIMLQCYLNSNTVNIFSNLLEGMMARRRDAYRNGDSYNTEDSFKLPITRWNNDTKSEMVIGELTLGTQMINGIPRIVVTYYQTDKDKSIDIILCNHEVANTYSGTISIDKIDMSDISAFNLIRMIKVASEPTTTFQYNLGTSIVNAIIRALKGGNNNNNNDSGPSYNYGRSSDGEYSSF